MQFQKNDTCIIFGSSPFINIIGQNKINLLIEKYITFGINLIPYMGYKTDYWIWSDYGIYDNVKHLLHDYKIIISKEVYEREINDEINDEINPEYVFEGVSQIQHEFNNNLCIFKTSAHPAINYAYLLGFKNIILVGIDLTSNWNHFYPSDKFIRTDKRIERIRNKLYEFKKYINLYTLNKDSDLEIEKVKFEDLV